MYEISSLRVKTVRTEKWTQRHTPPCAYSHSFTPISLHCTCVCQILYESSFEVVNANVAVLRSYILKCMSGGTVFP